MREFGDIDQCNIQVCTAPMCVRSIEQFEETGACRQNPEIDGSSSELNW